MKQIEKRNLTTRVDDQERAMIQEWAKANGHKSLNTAVLALVSRGLVADQRTPEQPALVAGPGPDRDQLHAMAMMTAGTAHTVLGMVLRLMSDHNATKEDKRGAIECLRAACEAIEDTL